jgi:hypothetical protein
MRGSSLLKAHQWAKSNLARSNPDAGAQDYTIQSVGGTPLTLSDLTNDSYDEVLLIGSVKSNPSSRHLPKTTNYPATYPDYNYPSYTRRPTRVGNRVPELLAEDIEPAMVERLVAQKGYFGGLNLIVKLQNTSARANDYTSPKFAALLQNLANADRKVKSNPGKALYTSLNNTNGGILTAGEATRAFFQEYLGANIPGELGPSATSTIKNWSTEIRKYGLDDTKSFENFMNEVLEPFLVIRSANVGLLRAIRLPENSEHLLKKINKKGNKYAMFEDTPIYKKLMTYLPIKAEDFYEGIDYAIVAHPYFAYPELAEVMTDKKLLDNLLSILEAAPQSFMKQGTARSDLEVRSDLRSSLSRLLKIGDQFLYDAIQDAQLNVLKESNDANQQALEISSLKEMISTDLADPSKFIKTLPAKKNKIMLVNGLAGFPTTPPPYWPRPIAYSVMDVIAENLQKILLSADQGGAQEALATSLANSLGVRVLPNLENETDPVVISVGNTTFTTNRATVFHAYHHLEDPLVKEMVANGDSTFGPNVPVGRRGYGQRIALASTTWLVDPSTKRAKRHYAKLIDTVEGWRVVSKFKELFSGNTNDLTTAANTMVPLMTLFAGVEDYSQNKYKYTVNEGERVFILELLRRSLQDLNVKSGTTNTAFAGVASGMTPSELKKIISDICENTEATENEVLTFLTFKVNYDALRAAIQTTTMTQTDVTRIENDVNMATTQASLVYKNYILSNPLSLGPTFGPMSAVDRTMLDDLVDKLQDELIVGDTGLKYISNEVQERIVEPGVNMTLSKIQVTIDENNQSNFAKMTDIMVDINEITEEALGLLASHKSVSFGQYRPRRDFDDPTNQMQREALADEIDKITEFVRARNPEYQLLRLKIDGVLNRLNDFNTTLTNEINIFQAQGQNIFNVTSSSYSSTTAMKRVTVRLIDLLGDVRIIIQSPPRSARTLGLAIPQNRFNQMRSTFFEDVGGQIIPITIRGRRVPGTQTVSPERYYPKGYYKSIDLCIQVVEKLSPVQDDIVDNFQNFRIQQPAVSAQDIGESLVSLASAIDLDMPKPKKIDVEEYADEVRGKIRPYF